MGLLDWLTQGIGSDMGGGSPMQPGPGSQMGGMDPMGNPTGQSMPLPTPAPAPTRPMPPMQQTGPDGYPIAGDPMTAGGPPPNNFDPMTAGGQSPNGPGLPFAPGTDPMTAGGPPPFPPGMDPMNAGGAPPNGPGLPPSAGMNFTATPRPAPPPGPPLPLPPPGNGTNGVGPGLGVGAPDMSQAGRGSSFIGRSLGLNPNSERTVFGGLAAGLKAAGNSAGKSPFQAFAGGAGETMEGSQKANKDITAEQSKYLNDAIKAQQAGDTGKLNIARTRLALAQAKAAETGKDTKASVLNSQEQLYLRGLGAVNQDGKVKASLAQLRSIQTQFGADSKEAKAALTAHNDLIAGTKKQVFATLGVNEKDAEKIGKQPGFSSDNPVPKAGLTKEKFDALPVGAYFINPKDNQLLIKQPPAGASPTPQAQSPTPAAPPPVTAPAGSRADQEDDE
jgi:hypothetical protein